MQIIANIQGEVIEDAVLVTIVQKIMRIDGKLGERGKCREDPQQPVGLTVRQGFEQNAIDYAEYGAVRANPQCQRQHGHGREAGIFDQRSPAIAKILFETFHGLSSAKVY